MLTTFNTHIKNNFSGLTNQKILLAVSGGLDSMVLADLCLKSDFNILELKPGCSQEEIKKAYKKMAIKYHPDKQNDKSSEEKAIAEAKFKEIA